MQLRQTETVCAMHDDRVGAGHINAGLNNGGAQQHIEALLVKIAHDCFQIAFGHLAVSHPDARFR